MKNPFKRKGVANPKAPRELKEIQAEYNQLSARAGQNQYQTYVLTEDLKQINKRLVEVNQEAAHRNKLDAEKKAQEPKVEAKNE